MSSECRRAIKEIVRLANPNICKKCGGCSDGPQWKKFHWIQIEKDGVIEIGPYAIEGELPADDHDELARA